METTTDTSPLPLTAGTWTLDRDHSSISFAIRHLGISKVRGSFHDFEVDVVVGETAAETAVTARIDLSSIDTGNPDRDAHVRSADLLDVERRSTLVFTSSAVTRHDDRWRLEGVLELGGVTTAVAFTVEFGGIEVFPVDGSRHAGLEARGSVDRHDLGVDLGALDAGLGRKVQFELDVQVVAPE